MLRRPSAPDSTARESRVEPQRVVAKRANGWYAENWQSKFHFYRSEDSLCRRYWLAKRIHNDAFLRTVPLRQRCVKCEARRRRKR